jgi:biopolymer transport protein ExbB
MRNKTLVISPPLVPPQGEKEQFGWKPLFLKSPFGGFRGRESRTSVFAITAVTILLCCAQFLFAKHDHEEHEKVAQELAAAKEQYKAAQAQLQRATDNRWSSRQRQVDAKEQLERDAEALQRDIERLYAVVARVREENIIRQGNLATATENLGRQKESFEWIGKTLEGLLSKEEDFVRSSMPVNQQERSLALQRIMQGQTFKNNMRQRLSGLHAYFLDQIRRSRTVDLTHGSLVTGDNVMHEAAILRFGNVFAVAANDTGACYYLGNTGSESSGGYEWVTLNDPSAVSNVKKNLPVWMKDGMVDGELHVDVMQNKYSGDLLGMKKQGFWQETMAFFRAGGIVMIPLGIIALWAIILVLNRLIVFSFAHSRDNRFMDEAVGFLNQKKMDEAAALASRSRGVLARILKTCLDHAKWNRSAAEKAIKEFLLAEVPVLDKHLDSLAVIAGAAPLLGLLGTVTGMIRMFESITRFGTGDPKLLAGGISEALVTTEVGLAIAIPVLLVHNFLRNRRNHLQADMEMYAMRILNRLWPQE